VNRHSSTWLLALLLGLFCGLVAHAQHRNKPQKHVSLGKPVEILVARDGAFTTSGITDHRDLTAYDDGGHFDCRRYTNDSAKDQANAETRISYSLNDARNFIWKHWQDKTRRGYLRISMNSVDASSTSHIFIEPDAKGDWRVVWRIVQNHALLRHGLLNDVPTIRSIEQESSGSSYILVFMSADKTELETL